MAIVRWVGGLLAEFDQPIASKHFQVGKVGLPPLGCLLPSADGNPAGASPPPPPDIAPRFDNHLLNLKMFRGNGLSELSKLISSGSAATMPRGMLDD